MKSPSHTLVTCALIATFLLAPTIRSPVSLAQDDKSGSDKDKEPKKPTKEEREAAAEKLRIARAPSTLVKRAQKKISEFSEDDEPKLCSVTILYGKDENDQKDVKAFAEFANGSIGIYYANVNPASDAWFVIEKDDLKVIEDIVARQKNR